MSLSASVGTQIPTNVVEVGNEISQNSINAIAASSSPSTINPMMTSSAVAATYATKASPTFTGTVTIPAGASISGYATQTYVTSQGYITSSALTGYATQTWVTSQGYITSSALTGYATQSYVTSQGYLTDAPSNGNEYVRKNGAWSVATGGGGGATTWGSITGTISSQTDLTGYVTGLGYLTDAPSDGSEYVRKNGAWSIATGGGGGISDAPADGVTYGRKDNAWESLASYATQSWVGSQNFLSVKTVNTISASANYTLTAGDHQKVQWLAGGMSGAQLTVPDDGTYNFPVGTEITVVCDDLTGFTQISGLYSGMPTINGSSTVITANIKYVGHLVKIASNTWLYS